MLEERRNYHLILSVNNDIIKLLTYEKAIKEHAAKKLGRQPPSGNCYLRTEEAEARMVARCSPYLRSWPGLSSRHSRASAQTSVPYLAAPPAHFTLERSSGSER